MTVLLKCSGTVQVKRLKKQLTDRKHRVMSLERHASELEHERDSLHALWVSEKEKHAFVQKAMMRTVTSAGFGLSARLSKPSCRTGESS
jgi:tRNA uridine 5-carbamoylmethylation protein Kti12